MRVKIHFKMLVKLILCGKWFRLTKYRWQ